MTARVIHEKALPDMAPNEPTLRQIRRRPVPGASSQVPRPILDVRQHISAERELAEDFGELTLSPEQAHFLTDDSYSPQSTGLVTPTSSNISQGIHTPNSPQTQSHWKSALGDIRHFAGGLVSHPHESTKHYSVLRHSHGLVYYKGSYTNLAVTIFSDRPLPDDRQLWIQRRGWSGKTGMKVGASFMNLTKGAWLNVTPSVKAREDQLPPNDERAWQRDIQKFLRKAPKAIQSHQVRETCVLRIPCHADDGYLRVILCAGEKGKKVLCPSPIFRLASTSASASSIKGASLSTLPLELAIKIGSVVANSATQNALSPVTGAMSGQVQQLQQQYNPYGLTKKVATTAYDQTGIQDVISNANQLADVDYDNSYRQFGPDGFEGLGQPELVGPESGPIDPFPVRFHGKIISGTGKSRAELGMPTANVSGVSEEKLLKHKGTYLGWVSVSTSEMKLREELPAEWLQAVISVIPCTESAAKVVPKKVVRVYMIYDFEDLSLVDCKLSIMMMGFLRPHNDLDPFSAPQDRKQLLFDIYKDISITQASLARPEWAAETTLEKVKSAASSRSLTEKYADIRTRGQRQVGKVTAPLALAGVRTNNAALRDQMIGNGGVYVPR